MSELRDERPRSGFVVYDVKNLSIVLSTLYMMFIDSVRSYMTGFSDDEFSCGYGKQPFVIKINIESDGVMTIITLLYIVGRSKNDIMCKFTFNHSSKELTTEMGGVTHLSGEIMRYLSLCMENKAPAVNPRNLPYYIFWEYLLTDLEKGEFEEKLAVFDAEFGHIDPRALPRTFPKLIVELNGIKYHYTTFFKIAGTDEPVDLKTMFVQVCLSFLE